MKRLILSLFFGIGALSAPAQIFSYGPTVGVGTSNIHGNGVDATASFQYQVGAFARVKLLALYVQPEVLYNSLSATSNATDQTLSLSRLDVPVNFGFKLLLFDLHTGPVFTAPLSASYGDIDMKSSYNSTAFNWDIGVGAELGPVHAGIRYTWGIEDATTTGNRWRYTNLFVQYQF